MRQKEAVLTDKRRGDAVTVQMCTVLKDVLDDTEAMLLVGVGVRAAQRAARTEEGVQGGIPGAGALPKGESDPRGPGRPAWEATPAACSRQHMPQG